MDRFTEYTKCVALGYRKDFDEWMKENFPTGGPIEDSDNTPEPRIIRQYRVIDERLGNDSGPFTADQIYAYCEEHGIVARMRLDYSAIVDPNGETVATIVKGENANV
ncbi:MAG: hypothetical protein BWY28_03131 [bacterium ADurb.Bin236]|nr:MAG: hypothetical protein BWY28_03131 [bacterium ADurb.Bin236]